MDELTKLLRDWQKAKSPETVFGPLEGSIEQQRALLRKIYLRKCADVHPDTHRDQEAQANEAMQLLSEWRQKAEAKIGRGSYGKSEDLPPAIDAVTIRSKKRTYTNVIPFKQGDICDLYRADFKLGGDSAEAVIKVAHEPSDADLLENETAVLKHLWSSSDKGAKHFTKYLPKVIESLKVNVGGKKMRPANILGYESDAIALDEVIAAYPSGLDTRDVAWMWKRMLEGLTWIHQQGVIHGAILPPHLLIHPANHGLTIIDWCYAVQPVTADTRITAMSVDHAAYYAPEVERKMPATPGTDIYMVAKCVLKLLGGDLETNQLPVSVPRPIAGLIAACLIVNPRVRYNNAWELYQDLNKALFALYGPPAFRPFRMPE